MIQPDLRAPGEGHDYDDAALRELRAVFAFQAADALSVLLSDGRTLALPVHAVLREDPGTSLSWRISAGGSAIECRNADRCARWDVAGLVSHPAARIIGKPDARLG